MFRTIRYRKKQFHLDKKVSFPHSLGIFIKQLLNFWLNTMEKSTVMGLAAYGKKYIDEMYKLFKIKKNNTYELNLEYFTHHYKSFYIILKMVSIF